MWFAKISSATKPGAIRPRLGLKESPNSVKSCFGECKVLSGWEPVCTRMRRVYIQGQVKSWSGSGSPIVTMMQPAESLLRQDATCASGWISTVRSSLRKSKMRAVLVVVTDVLRKQPFQMAFIHGDNMIQQVSSATFDPTLCHTVLPGTLEGDPHSAHLQGSNGHGDLQPVFRIPVED